MKNWVIKKYRLIKHIAFYSVRFSIKALKEKYLYTNIPSVLTDKITQAFNQF